MNIAKTSSLKRVRSAVVKLQIARNSMTDVYTDTEYSVTMLAVVAEHRGFVIRKMPLKFGTGGLKMTLDKYLDIVADTWLDMYLGNSLPSGARGYLVSTPKDATKIIGIARDMIQRGEY